MDSLSFSIPPVAPPLRDGDYAVPPPGIAPEPMPYYEMPPAGIPPEPLPFLRADEDDLSIPPEVPPLQVVAESNLGFSVYSSGLNMPLVEF